MVDGELWPFAVGGVGCLHCVVDLVGESHGDCNVMRCLFFGLCESEISFGVTYDSRQGRDRDNRRQSEIVEVGEPICPL